jgi:hypothetical protein
VGHCCFFSLFARFTFAFFPDVPTCASCVGWAQNESAAANSGGA